MYKRALMLTAATVALLSGAAQAQTDTITTKVTTPLKTSTAGPGNTPANILITDTTTTPIQTGSVVIPPSSTAATIPAIEIDSSNTVTLKNADDILSFINTSGAIGIQMDATGITGEVVNAGTIDLSGTGSGKFGILIGTATQLGSFTGLVDTTNFPTLTTPTAVDLQAGSTLKVVGDASTGISLAANDTLNGNIYVGGSVLVTATTTTATTNSGAVTGIALNGTMNGNLMIAPGGSVATIGAGAQGVEILGQLNGEFENFGSLTAAGLAPSTTTTTTPPVTGNPLSGSALLVGNSITGGIYNSGASNGNTTETGAQILSQGLLPTIDIESGLNTTAPVPVTIGTFTDPDSVITGNISFMNRGTISATPTDENANASAISLLGASAINSVTFNGNFVNVGTISASSGNTSAATSGSPTNVTGIYAGPYVNIPEILNGTDFTSGSITANENGAAPAIVKTLFIDQNANVSTLVNTGKIASIATSSDPTIASLSAWAVLDNSGTLLNINNSGSITATASALNNNEQIAIALDLRSEPASSGIMINNSGTIGGDVLLGQGNDTIIVGNVVPNTPAVIGPSGAHETIDFGGGNDTLTLNSNSSVTGSILEENGGSIGITIASAATLNVQNNGLANTNDGATAPGLALPLSTSAGLQVSSLDVQNGGTLGLTLAEPFNLTVAGNRGPIVNSSGVITLDTTSTVNISYGSFVTASNVTPAQFVVFDAPGGDLHIADPSNIEADVTTGIPFLFTGTVCTVNFSPATDCATPPAPTTNSQLVLSLSPKSAADIGLTGYAAQLFPFANAALAKDGALGSAVVSAGLGLPGTPAQIAAEGQKVYQAIYSEFAPDVTGAARALAISLTDQATGPVAARQRELRMYAGQDGDATLWGQEFAQRLNVDAKVTSGGYNNSGFGFVMGMDTGDRTDGRYGGAFTFFSGDTAEKSPRDSKTTSQWYMLTGYTDWRGKGMFFDSQLSAGYGNLDGKRFLNISAPDTTAGPGASLISRTAEGKRAAEFLAGGFTTGFIANTGGTVLIPQISIDGLTMRQEGYSESNNNVTSPQTDGFDLNVRQAYANSLRGFAGVDLRQDLNFGIFFLQPELRAGYRYDFLSGAEKLTANFLSLPTSTFSITGPDPSQGNLVLGGGLAVTTGAWSLGVNYDYKRGIGGTGGVDQTGVFTLIGRI